MITYKVVDSSHEVCGDDPPDHLHPFMKKFWRSRQLDGCYGAVIAKEDDKVIGFFRYDKMGNDLWAYGTYVMPKYRKSGVALELWKRALKKEKPRGITVITTSVDGQKLTAALSKRFPKYFWNIEKSTW